MRSRILGGLLLLASLVLLVAAPDEFSTVNMLGFLGCFVPGVLLLTGILGRSSRVEVALATPAATLPEGCLVPERREFRFRRAGVLLWIVYGMLFLLFAALGTFIAVAGEGEVKFMALPMFAFAVGLVLYLRAHYRQNIVVDASGIRARGYLRTVDLAWSDVAVLQWLTIHSLSAGPIGSVFRIHSKRGVIRYTDALEGASELCAIVSAATGREWGG